MTIEQMTETTRTLTETDTCPICHDRYLIPCYDHRLTIDADGDLWCSTCDTGCVKPQPVNCPCTDRQG